MQKFFAHTYAGEQPPQFLREFYASQGEAPKVQLICKLKKKTRVWFCLYTKLNEQKNFKILWSKLLSVVSKYNIISFDCEINK